MDLARNRLALVVALSLGSTLPTWAQTAADAKAWPHVLTENGAVVTVYQPQAIAWPDHATLTARAAVSITRPGGKAPVLGTIEVALATQTDDADRVVTLSDPKLTASHFPSLDTGEATRLDERLRASLGTIALKQVSLDSVLLSLADTVKPAGVLLDNDPPTIFHSARPASLVVFDGDPVLVPVGNTTLSYAVNTNWDVLFDPADAGAWYLLNDGAWFVATAAAGPYRPAGRLPAAFLSLPNDANFSTMRKSIPGRPAVAENASTIFVSTRPAEIIVTDGPPQFSAIAGTKLQQVRNTNVALFRYADDNRFYVLFSGRWFAAAGLDGPWSFATPDLPPDFAMIPADASAAPVLAAVPGTAPAQQALIEAQIPRQAMLKRSETKLTVTYVGKPEFKPIPGTAVAYAANTTSEVLEISGKYYACYLGAWFTAPAPTGPWVLADSLPEAVYKIPPSAPIYNVTYVKVYQATPEAVTYGFTAGYTMGFVTAGVLAYGTGYYYPPVIVPSRVPAYLPYPYTYAGGVYYNPATGAWARGGAIYGPYGGAAKGGAYYNPTTGGYARGGAVYGPYGGAGAWSAYNPATGTYSHGSAAWGVNGGTANASFYNPRYGMSGSTTQNANPYGRWGSSVVSGPNQTVHTESGSNARGSAGAFSSSTGVQGAGVHGTKGNSAGVVKGAGGNVYAGRDGNVYKHTDTGWSKWNGGAWNSVQPSSQPNGNGGLSQLHTNPNTAGATQSRATRPSFDSQSYGQLEQDRQARQFGNQRVQGGNESRSRGRFR